MNTTVTPTAADLPTLELLNASGVVIDTVPVISAGGHAYTRNRQGFQAYQQEVQGASGDGSRVIGLRTIDLLILSTTAAPANARLYQLDAALATAVQLRLDGIVIAISGTQGFTATQPLTGDRAGDLKATLTYIPTTQAAENAAAQPVLGPL